MIELILLALAGIGVGIFTGLLPALPVFTGPFLLYYFHSDFPLEHLLVFWLAVVSGSQFFGSVAVITTRIPGEESSAIYLRDLDTLSLNQKNKLLYNTATGSYLAGMFAVVLMWLVIKYMNYDILPTIMSVNFQIVVYTLALASFFFVNRSIAWTIGLITLGIVIGPRNNYALPDLWYQIQEVFQGYTFYMVILGTILLPEIFFNEKSHVGGGKYTSISDKFKWLSGIKNSVIGSLSGLIPGPSASLGATYAYRLAGKKIEDKIIAAETANNASVLTVALPLLLLALPININTMIMSNLMDIKSIDLPIEMMEMSSVFQSISIIEVVLYSLPIILTIYYILSTHLIDWYIGIIHALHHKIKLVLALIVVLLIGVDLYASEITFDRYLILLSFFSVIGYVLKRYNINPIVLLFSIILSDKLIWLYIQMLIINS
jgi:TctA family transporter